MTKRKEQKQSKSTHVKLFQKRQQRQCSALACGLFLCSHRFDAQVSLRSFTHPSPVYVLMLPTAAWLSQQLNTRLLSSSEARRRRERSTHTSPAGSLSCALLRPLSLPSPLSSTPLLSAPFFLVGQRNRAKRQGTMRTVVKKGDGDWGCDAAARRRGMVRRSARQGLLLCVVVVCAHARLCVGRAASPRDMQSQWLHPLHIYLERGGRRARLNVTYFLLFCLWLCTFHSVLCVHEEKHTAAFFCLLLFVVVMFDCDVE